MPEYRLDRNVMVPMRDGVRLATDIYHPLTGDGPWPVIMERTPYDKSEASRSEVTVDNTSPKSREEVAGYFVRQGYVFVNQDCRGRYHSEGSFTKYLNEGRDGYDTLAWMVEQPWCNGRIGTMGLSYAAHTQGAAACLNPPGLACMFLDSGGFSDAFQGGIRQGGAFELKQLTWAFRQGLASPEVQEDPVKKAAMKAIDLKDWFERLPWKKGHSPLQWLPEYEDYVFEQWQRGAFDSYWQQVGIYARGFYDTYADVPTVHMSSWYDAYVRTATDNFLNLSQRKKASLCLVMGPWTHGNRSLSYHGDVDFGPRATLDRNLAPDYLSYRLSWFDHWLKGIDNGVDREPPVHIFVMGGGTGKKNPDGRLDHGGCWRHENAWPLPGTRFTPYFLHPDHSMSPETPEKDSRLTYNHDPRQPIPTIGGAITSGEPLMTGGAFDQREAPRFYGCRPPYLPLAARPDILVFQTPPLENDMEITGPIQVRLWISSDCPDTDFTVKLVDYYPPSPDYPQGFAMNITDGILRARYRNSWSKPEMMTPGQVYEITVDPFPTSNLFQAGHRIRLDISSSNFPHFDVNPNTGHPEGAGFNTRIAANTIHLGPQTPSHVLLPIIPAERG